MIMHAVGDCTLSVWHGNISVCIKKVSETINLHAFVHDTPSAWLDSPSVWKKISEIENDNAGCHCTSSVWLVIMSVWNKKISEIKNPHVVVLYIPSVWPCSLSA